MIPSDLQTAAFICILQVGFTTLCGLLLLNLLIRLKPSVATTAGYATICLVVACLLYTSPSPRDATLSRMPSSA